jgi:PIN domain nuclease of toxin-antitoxin system
MLLLDTHALVWLASDPKKLSAPAKRAIRQHADQLYVSSISALEIAILVKRNRLSLPIPPEEYIGRALTQHGIRELPVDYRVAVASADLPDIHLDPFDRMIIATAQLNRMTILSMDRIISKYPGVKVIW